MQRHHIDSSVFRSVGYDAAHAVLEAEFKDGDIYRYFMVPRRLWRAFKEAASKGEFFAENIRDRYRFEKIN